MPAKAAQIAIARGRSFGGNTWARIDSVAGMMNAAPTPITARGGDERVRPSRTARRAPMRPPKITSPALSASRRPNRSPSEPAVSSSPANTRP